MNILFFESEMDMPLKMVKLPLRSTVIKTSKGLLLISPIQFSKHQIKEIKEMGEVVAIIEPSLIHHLFVQDAIEHFPDAKVWGPVGCRKKTPHVHWDKIIGKDRWPYGKEVEVLPIKGMPSINEAAFFEKSSRALIVGDFCFNLLHPKGWAAPVMLRIMGIHKKFAVSRFFKLFIKDKKLFNQSVDKILKWDFDHIVMSHGEIVPADGKQKVLGALKERGYSFNLRTIASKVEPLRLAFSA